MSETGAPRVAVTSAGVAAVFLLLRILAVSHWDWHTAFAVTHTVEFDDAIGIVFGTLMANAAFTSILLMGILPMAVLALVRPIDDVRSHPATLLFVLALLAAYVSLLISFGYWWLLAGSLLITAGLVVARYVWRRGIAHQVVQAVLHSVALIAVLGFLVLAGLVNTPWMPLERIETRSGELTGYVLVAEPGFVKVLTDDQRRFLILRDDEVISREEIAH